MIAQKKKIKLYKFHYFIIGITILKIVLMGLFSSDYQDKMFIPFVNQFIKHMGTNPYDYYYANDIISSFPYPPLMLLIESIGGLLSMIVSNFSLFLSNIMFKMPSLILDCVALFYLVKMYPKQRKYIAVLYYASPIVIYSVYMHGQLDLIPTAFLIISLYYFTQKKDKHNIIASIILGFALATKLHILAVVPIIYLFLWKKQDGNIRKVITSAIITATTFTAFVIPFLGKGYVNLVLFNQEQKILTKIFLDYENIKVYIPIVAIVIIYLITASISNINKDLLISLCGMLFAVFLVLVPPMPGWYVWIVPFVTIFFVHSKKEKNINLSIYAGLNGLYLIFFIFFHKTKFVDLYLLKKDLSWLKVNSIVFKNIVFTVLVGFLMYTIFLLYQYGVASNSLYKRKNRPFTIGIAGDSGSGKSTLKRLVENCLGNSNLLFLEGDGDHRWERGEKMWEHFTHLNPKANYLYRQALDVKNLRMGVNISRVEYDHKTGTFTNSYKVKPKKYVMMCGLHSLYLPQMRKNLDLKIYIDSEETLRKYWKIQRDTNKRGYSKKEIVEQIEARVPDAKKYIMPQKEYANLIIQYFDKNLTDCYVDNYKVSLSVKFTLSAGINIETVLCELAQYDICADYEYTEDLRMQTVVFDGEELEKSEDTVINFEDIAQRIIPQLDEIPREEMRNMNTMEGITELILLILITHIMRGDME